MTTNPANSAAPGKTLTIDQAMTLANQLQTQGQLQQAEHLLRQILQQQPQHVFALHLLGVIAYQAGKLPQAAELVQRAIALLGGSDFSPTDSVGLHPQGVGRGCTGLKPQQHTHKPDPHGQGGRDFGPSSYAASPSTAQRRTNGHGNAAAPDNETRYARAPSHALPHPNPPPEGEGANASLREFHVKVRPTVEAKSLSLFHANLCEILRQLKQLDPAIAAGERAVALDPNMAMAHSNLGIAYFDRKDYDQAEACQQRALAIAPDFAAALNNLGSVWRERGDHDKALALYRQAAVANPNYLEPLNNLGALLLEEDRDPEAEAVLKKALQLNPNYPESICNLGGVHLAREENEQALEQYRRALALRPVYVEAQMGLAKTLQALENLNDAELAAIRALQFDETNPKAHALLAGIHTEMSQPTQAEAEYERALAIKPDSNDALLGLGHLCTENGQLERARELFQRALQFKPDNTAARIHLVQNDKVKADDAHFAALREEAEKMAEFSDNRRLSLHFALGKCYDDIKDYDKAFPHYLAGCKIKRAKFNYDADATARQFEELKAIFNPNNPPEREPVIPAQAGIQQEKNALCLNPLDSGLRRNDGANGKFEFNRGFIDSLRGSGDPSHKPIFVLGMPRSGTTLTEQIIASHPDVYGAGELPDLLRITHRKTHPDTTSFPDNLRYLDAAILRAWGEEYIAGLTQRAPDAKHITDKMPANFFAVPLIHLMLPNAKIIHVNRNPVDTCVSCFTRLFHRKQEHTYDLAELGRYYADYAKLMDHWRKVLPTGAFYDVQYENIVTDQEGEARKLLEYCGLEWNDACLDFHKTERQIRTASVTQVRQPIYTTSVERWRKYEKHLGPLLNALGDLVPGRQ